MVEGYKTLKVGDVRKAGDEVRHTQLNKNGFVSNLKGPFRLDDWKPVQLIGFKILKSDLVAAEFRRSLL